MGMNVVQSSSSPQWNGQDCQELGLVGEGGERLVPSPSPSQRNCGLDLLRTICVLFVAVAHGPVNGDRYADWNVFDANLWVLYFLTLLSAMLLARSRSHLLPYLLRLTIVFFLGVFLNALAVKVQGRDVLDADHLGPSRFLAPDNELVLQMGYILCIQAFGAYFYAMRTLAHYGWRSVAALCSATSGALLLLQLVMGPTAWSGIFRCAVVICTSGYLVRAGLAREVNKRSALAASVSAAVFVMTLEVTGWDEYNHQDHLVGPKGINMLTFYAWGFSWGLVKDFVHTEKALRTAGTYWPVALPWLLTAGVPLRVDLESPKDLGQRLAVLASWLTFAGGFLLYSCVQLEDFLGIAGPLNYWSLAWYCGHMLMGALLDSTWYYYVLAASYLLTVAFGMRRTLWATISSPA